MKIKDDATQQQEPEVKRDKENSSKNTITCTRITNMLITNEFTLRANSVSFILSKIANDINLIRYKLVYDKSNSFVPDTSL